ncbi:MAG: NAD-glutamate dehydrogenase, partial [Novosphingobium sp.]|nr:NAD-glutamate dehydrogenase [Novosphingobium sp.]
MTAKTKARPAGKPTAELADLLAARFSASALPGDAALADDKLAEAAQFAVAAAEVRQPGEPALSIETTTGKVGERMTRIAVINDNMPFLLDSIAAAISAQGLAIDVLFHPVLNVTRDKEGKLRSIPPGPGKDTNRESFIYIETARADARTRVRLRNALEAVLDDVRAAVSDWPALQDAMAADAIRLDETGETEGAALLRWFNGGMLTQLGHVVRRRDGTNADPLGICRRGTRTLLRPESCARAFAWFDDAAQPAPLIVKANRLNNVHRRVPLDLFIVPVIEKGKVRALSIHAGVWTSAALSAPPKEVPRIRAQLAASMARLGVHPEDHDGKALVHALTELPHDLVIGFDDTEIERVVTRMMSLIDRPRPDVVLMRSPLDRHLFAFVWLPRDAVSTTLRLEILAMLEQSADSPVLDWSLEIDGALALLRVTLDIRDGSNGIDERELGSVLSSMVRGWTEAVDVELSERVDPARAAAMAGRYAEAFPISYRTTYGPVEAALDIERLHNLSTAMDGANPRRDARLHCRTGCPEGRLELKIYQRRGSLPLSDAVPMLEHFGFRVLGEVPTVLENGDLGAVHDFELELPAAISGSEMLDRAPAIEAAIAAVLNGEAEDDGFNRLITSAGLAAREADWLRAWYRYLRQTGSNYGLPTAVRALEMAPNVTRGLIDLFLSRHDPDFDGDRAEAEKSAATAIRDGLAEVTAINDDRLLRHYRALIGAILRTNAFAVRTDRQSSAALAFKLDSSAVPGLPAPVPWREVFVYSRRVEGIHLRAGPVARGGLRWSDRRDDYRLEVLGLMKAQRVKNAVIVPTGAKGGFYPKQLPSPATDRDAWLAEGTESYRIFIRSLLSLTDNIVNGKVVHPKRMVIHDQDDPYFVVAAD